MNDSKKYKFAMMNSFFRGVLSIFNFSGPEPKEYYMFFESNQSKALKSHWDNVGKSIQTSMQSLDAKILTK